MQRVTWLQGTGLEEELEERGPQAPAESLGLGCREYQHFGFVWDAVSCVCSVLPPVEDTLVSDCPGSVGISRGCSTGLGQAMRACQTLRKVQEVPGLM